MTVGERIKRRRLELGLTQEELAQKMNYKGKTSVCVVETGGDNVTTTKVKKFAEALGVSPSFLMGWEDPIASYVDSTYTDSESKEDLTKKAMELYELYENVSPDVQQAVELMLKSSQQKP